MSELSPCKLCGVVPTHRADGLIAHGTWESACPLWESSWMTPEQWAKLMGQGEPVAWMKRGGRIFKDSVHIAKEHAERSAVNDKGAEVVPLFAAPPQAQGDDVLRDAMRYRWLRSAETMPFNIMKMENIGELLDLQVDAAMNGFLK